MKSNIKDFGTAVLPNCALISCTASDKMKTFQSTRGDSAEIFHLCSYGFFFSEDIERHLYLCKKFGQVGKLIHQVPVLGTILSAAQHPHKVHIRHKSSALLQE